MLLLVMIRSKSRISVINCKNFLARVSQADFTDITFKAKTPGLCLTSRHTLTPIHILQPFRKTENSKNLKVILLISAAPLFLRRRDGRAVECGGLENR